MTPRGRRTGPGEKGEEIGRDSPDDGRGNGSQSRGGSDKKGSDNKGSNKVDKGKGGKGRN